MTSQNLLSTKIKSIRALNDVRGGETAVTFRSGPGAAIFAMFPLLPKFQFSGLEKVAASYKLELAPLTNSTEFRQTCGLGATTRVIRQTLRRICGAVLNYSDYRSQARLFQNVK